MKFKVNQKLKEITFPLIKRNVNKEQAFIVNKVLTKLVNNLQEKLKIKNDEINIIRNNGNITGIDSKIIKSDNELKCIIKAIKGKDDKKEEINENENENENKSSKKSKKSKISTISKISNTEIEFKLLFSINIYDENIINQLIDFATQFNNQCLAITEFESKKIGIIFTHKKEGNFYFMINDDSVRLHIVDFYIDKEKFFFQLENKSTQNNQNNNEETIKYFSINEFTQMEFFNCLITK